MIKFFRKIRQNLLLENKTGKYFKYAIGEILLVVIGILIALSINNWNTKKIQDANVLRLSIRLLAETERNIINLEKDKAQAQIAAYVYIIPKSSICFVLFCFNKILRKDIKAYN